MGKMLTTARYGNITLRSSGQLWSNVPWREQEEGIPAILANPSFLDLCNLCMRYSAAKIVQVNRTLIDAGEISQYRFNTTASMLHNIERGIARAALDGHLVAPAA
ncbi:MAG: hypothetical protein ABIO19_05475 [Burkholderiaceae bacterium]